MCVCYIHVMGDCRNPSLADVDRNLGSHDRTRIYQFGTDLKEVGLDGVTHWTPRNGLGPSLTSRLYKGIALV